MTRLHASRAEPILGGLEQGGEYLGVVLGLEEAEVAGGVGVPLEMQVIDLGADPADRAPVAEGEPVGDLGVIEPGVLLRIQVFEALEHQRLNPVPVAGMKPRRQQQEPLQGSAILDPLEV